jgi:hypothetical protein
MLFCGEDMLNSAPNQQPGGPPLVGCPRLFIKYISSYHPNVEAVSSIRNMRMRHAVVTRGPFCIDHNITVM